MLAFSLSDVFSTIFSMQALDLLLRIAAGVWVVAVLALTFTRWGQKHAMTKCIVLSIYAHVLLVGYARVTNFFTNERMLGPGPGGGDVMVVGLIKPSGGPNERNSNSDLADPSARETPTGEPAQPWETPAAPTTVPETPNLSPNIPVAPLSAVTRAAPALNPSAEASLSPPVASLPPLASLIAPPSPVPQIQATAPAMQAESGGVIAAPPVEGSAGNTARRENPRAAGPENTEPPRFVADSRTPTTEMPDSLRRPLPGDTFDSQSRAQSLANLSPDALPGSARNNTNSRNIPGEAVGPGPGTLPRTVEATTPGTSGVSLPQTLIAGGGPFVPAPPASVAEFLPSITRRTIDGEQLPYIYRLRVAENRGKVAERFGGNPRSEAAVEASLAWLATAQSADGHWDPSAYEGGRENRVLGQDRGGTGADAHTGVTGLAVLAYLSAGHTHLDGKYRKNVQLALEYLLRAQASNGSMAGPAKLYAQMYCHGMATLAISEAYAMTRDHRLKPFVERAIGYTIAAQHPTSGGWRYQPGDLGDTSQFGWQLMALRSAEQAGIPMPSKTREGAYKFLRSVSSGEHGGLASYRPGEKVTSSMTAEALACRMFLGIRSDDPAIAEAARRVTSEPPENQHNVYYWYYASISLFQLHNESWEKWNKSMQPLLLDSQRKAGDLAGSWDPDPTWGGHGGRVYSTAMSTLCLEVYYRYLPIYAGSNLPIQEASRTDEGGSTRQR